MSIFPLSGEKISAPGLRPNPYAKQNSHVGICSERESNKREVKLQLPEGPSKYLFRTSWTMVMLAYHLKYEMNTNN